MPLYSLHSIDCGCLGVHGVGGFVRHQTNLDEHDPEICLDRIGEWGKTPECPLPNFAPSPPSAWKWIVGLYKKEMKSVQRTESSGLLVGGYSNALRTDGRTEKSYNQLQIQREYKNNFFFIISPII